MKIIKNNRSGRMAVLTNHRNIMKIIKNNRSGQMVVLTNHRNIMKMIKNNRNWGGLSGKLQNLFLQFWAKKKAR